MATVFMKWLERRPETYDRGIQMLTLGRLNELWESLVASHIHEGSRVLELGCGTGGLTIKMAQAGAEITAIDVDPRMLEEAITRLSASSVSDRVEFIRLDAIEIGDQFPQASFDVIVSSLMLSELTPEQRDVVLHSCEGLLTAEGRLVILDEVLPAGRFERAIYTLARTPLSVLTWLLTRTGTRPLQDVRAWLADRGYQVKTDSSRLGGSLLLLSASPGFQQTPAVTKTPISRLWHKLTIKTLLLDLWALFFRILPPYPKVKPGLYAIGSPQGDSPVLVTGNYELTVRRVVKVLDGECDAWLLVVDSAGINVWCASGGGFLTADKVLSALKLNLVDEVVRHREIVLPQLAAAGVDAGQIRGASEWEVLWGPVEAADLPVYLKSNFQKSTQMRQVVFPLVKRLEMVSGTLGIYGLIILIPIALFWSHILLPAAIAMIALSYFYAIFLPYLPGRDGLAMAIPLTILAILGVVAHSIVWDPILASEMFNRLIGISALAIFIAGEFQGMSPLMRGEQANWIPEAAIGLVLASLYWILPQLLGWR